MSAQDEPRGPGDPFTREATRLRKNFLEMNLYEGFELAIMLVLTALIMLVTLFATWNLTKEVWQLVLAQRIDPSDMPTFQTVFGNIFTVIIALEFKSSLRISLSPNKDVVRVRTIVLIALLAVARKFIILDLHEVNPAEMFAFSAAVLALGVVYWLIREQDIRVASRTEPTVPFTSPHQDAGHG
ncbi:phosphate-starvation-inducible PsiE family protein [Acetobacter estunensis]|uniref:phosphate-starvation-inducible PsiE family protein n=1 Tax=Acetobacter estunensis TaxID=104097 RepID=UPI001C2D4517|nr:phosphate-starvation-inducible PsiE family protein [Acetobacter estunensis]MBV1837503.1 phosphate-starvation-inducible PsiE family protein [Acetobacter estunensis]